jgi:flavorubredoxin
VDLALDELGAYYANILLPFGAQISKVLEKVDAAGWRPQTIAPSHGVIWRGDLVERALEAYERWGARTSRDKVVVAYVTMWGATDQLAKTIGDAMAAEGVDVEVFDLSVTPFAKVMHELLDARGLLVGSPTMHRGMLYRIAGFLQYLVGLKPPGLLGAAFGSFGWSSGATAQIVERLGDAGVEVVQEAYTQKYRPTAEDLAAAREWGASFARAVKDADAGA